MLTKADDVAEAYRNIKTLSFNVFVQEMLKTIGTSAFWVDAMYSPLPADKAGFPNPKSKPLATLARDMHLNQLYPGKYLDILAQAFDRFFNRHLDASHMLQSCAYARSSEDGAILMPLMLWCSDLLSRAGQESYFGPLLREIDPGMTWKFLEFDENSHQVLFQYPKWLSSKMQRSKEALAKDLVIYFDTPQEQRHGDAWFVKAMENEMRTLKLTTYDIALTFVTIYWG